MLADFDQIVDGLFFQYMTCTRSPYARLIAARAWRCDWRMNLRRSSWH
jgi:hypothetical protein